MQPGLAGPLPLVPLLAAEPLAPGLASHLLIETVAPLFESLAQGRLLLAHPLHFPFQRDALAIGLLPLLVKLLVLGSQLAQLLTHPLQLLLAKLGLTQLLLALGQPLLQRLATAKQGAHQLVPLNGALAQRQRMAEQGIASQLLPALGQLLGAGFQLWQVLLAYRQLAGQLLTLALALNILMIEPFPLQLQAAGPLSQLTENAGHLWLALAVGVLPGTAQRARFAITQDMAILLEAGDGAGLLQRVARLIPLQGEPLAGGRQLFAYGGQLAKGLLQLGNLLLQAVMLFAVVAAIIGQLQQLAQLTQLFGLLLPLLLRLGEAALPLLLLQLVLLLLQPSLFMLPVVALLLALLQLALQLLQGAQLVIPQGEQLL